MTETELTGGGAGQTPIHPDDLDGLRHRWVTTQGQLDELERANILTAIRFAQSRSRATGEILDDVFFRNLHKRAFGEVWQWAGSYRRRATTLGVAPEEIGVQTRLALLDAQSQLEAATSEAAMRESLAVLHHRLTVVHPFPNGNGRIGRMLVDVAAQSVGLMIPTWGRGKDDARMRYLQALRQADRGFVDELVAFMWTS